MPRDQEHPPFRPIDELLEGLVTIPARPLGRHLTEEELQKLADETLPQELCERAFTHIESCLQCGDNALRAFEHRIHGPDIEVPIRGRKDNRKDRPAVVSMQEYIDAKNRNRARFPSTKLDRIQRVVNFGASSHTYHWRETLPDLGDVTVILDDRREYRTITIDTTSDLDGNLVGCGLCGNVDVSPLFMVLHPSRINPGHSRATARIDDGVTLPEPCYPNPYLLRTLPSAEQLVAAASYAHKKADYDALLSWIRLNTSDGLISGDVLKNVPVWEDIESVRNSRRR